MLGNIQLSPTFISTLSAGSISFKFWSVQALVQPHFVWLIHSCKTVCKPFTSPHCAPSVVWGKHRPKLHNLSLPLTDGVIWAGPLPPWSPSSSTVNTGPNVYFEVLSWGPQKWVVKAPGLIPGMGDTMITKLLAYTECQEWTLSPS